MKRSQPVAVRIEVLENRRLLCGTTGADMLAPTADTGGMSVEMPQGIDRSTEIREIIAKLTSEEKQVVIDSMEIAINRRLGAIALEQLALDTSQDADVQDFAQTAKAANQEVIDRLTEALQTNYGVSYTGHIPVVVQKQLDNLQMFSGSEFDQQFARDHIQLNVRLVRRALATDALVRTDKIKTYVDTAAIAGQATQISELGMILARFDATEGGQQVTDMTDLTTQQEFEVKYLEFTADHHAFAIRWAQAVVDNVTNEQLKTLLTQDIEQKQAELTQIQDILQNTYGISYDPNADRMVTTEMTDLMSNIDQLQGDQFDQAVARRYGLFELRDIGHSTTADGKVATTEVEDLADQIIVEGGQLISNIGTILQTYSVAAT